MPGYYCGTGQETLQVKNVTRTVLHVLCIVHFAKSYNKLDVTLQRPSSCMFAIQSPTGDS